MRVALIALLACAVVDLAACAVLLAVVWAEYRRVRREAAANGKVLPSEVGQFGCLIGAGLVGLVGIYAAAWLLLQD